MPPLAGACSVAYVSWRDCSCRGSFCNVPSIITTNNSSPLLPKDLGSYGLRARHERYDLVLDVTLLQGPGATGADTGATIRDASGKLLHWRWVKVFPSNASASGL